MISYSAIKFILNCIKPFRWWVSGQIFVGIIWAIDLSLRPYLLKVMIDCMQKFSLSQAYYVLLAPALFYISISLVIIIVFRFYDFIWLNLTPLLKRHISFVVMERMMQHSNSLYQNNFSGSLGNKIKDVMNGIPDLLRTIIDQFFSHILALLIAVGTVYAVSIEYSILLCMWVTIFIGGSFLLSKKARHLSDASAEIRSTVIGIIVDILSNIMNVRLFNGRLEERKKLGLILNDYVRVEQRRDWFFLKIHTFQGMSFIIYQSISLFWLIQGFKQGRISPGDFSLILMINIAIVNCLWSLSKDIRNFSELTGDIIQGLRIIMLPIEIEDKSDAQDLIVHQGKIVFSQVHFQYQGTKPLFQNKSVTILPRQKVGFVGYSGSGKTTFANLILRLFEVTSGHILIDGKDIRKVTQNSLYSNIGMIPQDPSLFHRTLMENIRYGRLNANDAEVIEAAKKAYAHEFIEKLPHGYDTLVGEHGLKLSGGQRQRVAIARAILKNAHILILDEATSQLDSVTENHIQDSLWNLMQGKTTIVIAHRLSTLLHMDRILVFDQGKILEDGTHQDLLTKGGLYKTLWDTQVGGFLPQKIAQHL